MNCFFTFWDVLSIYKSVNDSMLVLYGYKNPLQVEVESYINDQLKSYAKYIATSHYYR